MANAHKERGATVWGAWIVGICTVIAFGALQVQNSRQQYELQSLRTDVQRLERLTDFLQRSVREGRSPDPSLVLSAGGGKRSSSIESLLRDLKSGNFLRQLQAGQELAQMGENAAPSLVKMASSGSQEESRAAILLLGQMREPSSFPLVRQALAGRLDSRRAAGLLGILARGRDLTAQQTFESYLQHEDDLVRVAASTGLRRIASADSAGVLADQLAAAPPGLKRELSVALRALAKADPVATATALSGSLPTARFEAVRALSLDSAEQSRAVIRQALGDADDRVRLAAAQVLAVGGHDADAVDVIKAIAKKGGSIGELAARIINAKEGTPLPVPIPEPSLP